MPMREAARGPPWTKSTYTRHIRPNATKQGEYEMASVQYRIQLDEEIVQEISGMAEEFGEKSGQQVAADIITRYKDFYRIIKVAEKAAYEQQIAALEESVKTLKHRGR
jgi:hypothetical protein